MPGVYVGTYTDTRCICPEVLAGTPLCVGTATHQDVFSEHMLIRGAVKNARWCPGGHAFAKAAPVGGSCPPVCAWGSLVLKFPLPFPQFHPWPEQPPPGN